MIKKTAVKIKRECINKDSKVGRMLAQMDIKQNEIPTALQPLAEKYRAMNAKTKIDDVLAERGARYGNFADHARITQSIKFAIHTTEKWQHLEDDQMEALQMIAHKIGRILNGDPNYADSWMDIAGYAKLVADRLETAE